MPHPLLWPQTRALPLACFRPLPLQLMLLPAVPGGRDSWVRPLPVPFPLPLPLRWHRCSKRCCHYRRSDLRGGPSLCIGIAILSSPQLALLLQCASVLYYCCLRRPRRCRCRCQELSDRQCCKVCLSSITASRQIHCVLQPLAGMQCCLAAVAVGVAERATSLNFSARINAFQGCRISGSISCQDRSSLPIHYGIASIILQQSPNA